MPHRQSGSPENQTKRHLSGKPIRYYRPTGSQEVRALIDEGFKLLMLEDCPKHVACSRRKCSILSMMQPLDSRLLEQ